MRGAIILAGLVLLGAAGARAESTREEVMSAAERCEGIADNRVWLDCYYGAAQPMRSLLGLAPASPAQLKLVPPPGAAYVAGPAGSAARRAPAEPSRGFFGDILGSGRPTVENMPLASYRFAANRTFTVTLQNGQVYQQAENDTALARWNGPASAYLVTISPAGDKFTLKVKNEPGTVYRVVRR